MEPGGPPTLQVGGGEGTASWRFPAVRVLGFLLAVVVGVPFSPLKVSHF